MDIVTLLVGLGIGALIGFVVAWFWSSSVTKAHSKANTQTEVELKSLLEQQAQGHIQSSKGSLNNIENELNALRQSIAQYEQSLQPSESDGNSTPFFGEHASLFLRNTGENDVPVHNDSSEAQPKDFANNSSGLFAGNPTAIDSAAAAKSGK